MKDVLAVMSAINSFLLSWVWLIFLGVGVARLATTKGDESRKKSGKKILLWGVGIFVLFFVLDFLLRYFQFVFR